MTREAGRGSKSYGAELENGQTAFIHAGQDNVFWHESTQANFNLISENKNKFLFSNPIHIISKSKKVAKSIEIPPLSILDIKNILNKEDLSSEERVVELYDAIADYAEEQKRRVSKTFISKKEEILSELARLGYKEFDRDVTIEQKKELILNTLPFLAARNSDLEMIKSLLKTFSPKEIAEVTMVDDGNILGVAVELSDDRVVKFLADNLPFEILKKGNIQISKKVALTGQGDRMRNKFRILLEKFGYELDLQSAVHQAAYNGDFEFIKMIAENVPEKLREERYEENPFHICAALGSPNHLKALKIMAEALPDLMSEKRSIDTQTPLSLSIKTGNFAVAKFLIENLPPEKLLHTDPTIEMAPIGLAVYFGDLDMVKALAKKLGPKELGVVERDGTTAATLAAHLGKFPMLLELAKHGVDPNEATIYGTPLEIAINSGCDKDTQEKIADAYNSWKDKEEAREGVSPLSAEKIKSKGRDVVSEL